MLVPGLQASGNRGVGVPELLADRLYEWLARAETPDADHILSAALLRAEPPWSDRIIQTLLERGEDISWAGLVGRYETLPSDVRARLRSDPPKLYAAVALAMRSHCSQLRAGALSALSETAPPRMAYLIPGGLRDPQPKTRVLAGHVLRKMSERFLEQPPAESPQARRARAEDRRHIVQALRESIRSVDMHGRTEVLETALWFATDLGDDLWRLLNSRRSRAGVVVQEHLYEWDHPRLAGFLLLALQQPCWREMAVKLLQNWRTVEQVGAILEAGRRLDPAALRAGLAWVAAPRWFERLGREFEALPEALRPLLPWWIPGLGMPEEQKVALLSGVIGAADPHLHRAAVYALVELKSGAAQQILRTLADSSSPLAVFARWHAIGRQVLGIARGAEASDRFRVASASPPAARPSAGAGGLDAVFELLWRVARRTPPAQRARVVEMLRFDVEGWSARLAERMRSSDPRDRILALHVVSAAQLLPRFAAPIAALRDDPVESIRLLATRLERVAGALPVGPPSAPRPGADARKTSDPESLAVARADLQSLLTHLADDAADPADPEHLERVRELLEEVVGCAASKVCAGGGS